MLPGSIEAFSYCRSRLCKALLGLGLGQLVDDGARQSGFSKLASGEMRGQSLRRRKRHPTGRKTASSATVPPGAFASIRAVIVKKGPRQYTGMPFFFDAGTETRSASHFSRSP